MDLKTVELEILKINEEFITYIDKVNQESIENTESIIRDLNLKVDEKSTFLKSLEAQLIEADEAFKSKLNEFITKLNDLTTSTKDNKYVMEDAKVELEKQKEEELKPFLLQQKKKKMELAHKITSLRKELSFLHKDNNTKLLDEEKNYRNREVELTRRLGIDLDRLNEANIKQYSDIERGILELEDVKLIKEAQKKINSIRLVGIKENLNIKNKYAMQNYENALDFKKFQEKIILDNVILTEEFKQRVKALEYEKELIDDEEKLRIVLKDYDNELKLREFERVNELVQCEFETQKAENKYKLSAEILNVKNEQNKLLYESVSNINAEIYNFDKVQATQFIMADNYFISSDKKIIDSLLSSLRTYILSFKDLLIITAEDYSNKRQSMFANLVNVFSSSKVGLIYNSNSNYEPFNKTFGEIVQEYLKAINLSFVKFTDIIKTLIKGLEYQLNQTASALKNHWHEDEVLHNMFFNKVNKYFDDQYKNMEQKLASLNNSNNETALYNRQKDEAEYNKQIAIIKERTKKANNDYNIQKKSILTKIENYKHNLKIKQESDKKELNRFIKQSKYKINQFKSVYNQNISNHEKVEHNNYKEAIKQNKIEYKNRLDSIEK
jgi:hypothetical protein